MTAMNMKENKYLLAGMLILTCLFLFADKVPAKIPEPANVIYGTAVEGAGTITLEVNGEIISSYTMGDIPDAENLYVLTVPIDVLDPQMPGTARPGDSADIFVDNVLAGTIDIVEKGSIRKFDLTGSDTDFDEMPDTWEQQIIDADPGDDITTIADVLPDDDFDHDGDKNLTEYENGTDPTDALSSTRGDIDGDKYITIADIIIAISVMSNIEPETGIAAIADIDGDGRIGLQEAIQLLKRIAEE